MKELDALDDVDVIVVARGGGSVEDLLPFSDEQLVRAVAACRTPVVSAIGHEPDSPLLDLVADLRASTPTDAAKKVVPDVGEEYERVRLLRDRARRCVAAFVDREERGAGPRAGPAVDTGSAPDDRGAGRAGGGPAGPEPPFAAAPPRPGRLRADAHARARGGLSPAATLKRGYAVLQRADGHAVRDPGEVEPGEALRARVSEGDFSVPSRRIGWVDDQRGGAADGDVRGARVRAGAGRADRGRPAAGGRAVRRSEESLALWERGEELAKVCRRRLDGARARLDAALAEEETRARRTRPPGATTPSRGPWRGAWRVDPAAPAPLARAGRAVGLEAAHQEVQQAVALASCSGRGPRRRCRERAASSAGRGGAPRPAAPLG